MMDNKRKRKIVRNFVIGYLLLQVLVIVLYLGFWAVHPGGFVVAENERMSPPPMFPDYQGVTIPYNIAPLNFLFYCLVINVQRQLLYLII